MQGTVDVAAGRPAKGWWALLALALSLVACSTVPPSNARSNAKLTPTTGISRDLTQLPKPKARIPVAVYGFRDQTGQFKTSPESSYSTLVTQGAATILIKALEDSGWYTAVEREGLQNLLTERRIIRAIESPSEKGRPIINLPNMMPASIIIEGGVIAYESNVRTGGKGANYLGIGASTQYRVDQVTVSLRSIDVRYGQVLNSVSVTKTIYSYQFSASVFKYTSYQHLLQGETGFATNEPAQLAVREAIEAAVVHLTVNGIRDRYLELQDASAWFSPVIQTYMAEALGNVGEEPLAVDAMIPMRPMSAFREPVQPLPFGLETAQAAVPRARERVQPAVVVPAVQPSPAAAGLPVAPAVGAASVPTPSNAAQAQPPSNKPVPVPMPPSATDKPLQPVKATAAAVAAAAAMPAPAPTVSQRARPVTVAPLAPAPAPAPAAQSLPSPATPAAQSATTSSAPPKPVALPASANSAQPEGQKPAGKEDIFNLYWKTR